MKKHFNPVVNCQITTDEDGDSRLTVWGHTRRLAYFSRYVKANQDFEAIGEDIADQLLGRRNFGAAREEIISDIASGFAEEIRDELSLDGESLRFQICFRITFDPELGKVETDYFTNDMNGRYY